MRLSGFRVEREEGYVRAAADMVWEDSGREPATLFFQVAEEHGEGMIANPDSFLLAAAVPALHFGERRISVAGPVCPVLQEGLETVLSILAAWHHPTSASPPVIEVAERRSGLLPFRIERAGTFFSGGIDSYATLRLNMLAYPEAHPYRIRDGVLVFGFEQDDVAKFEHVAAVLEHAAHELHLGFLVVATNAYLLYREGDARNGFRFWEQEYQGSAFAAVAHSLCHCFSSMSISATISPRTFMPYGSHPMLDPYLSSTDMRVRHTGAGFTRLQKTALAIALGLAPGQLRVCNHYRLYQPNSLNCGRCGKCVRTKLELVALGREDLLAAFACTEISADLVSRAVRLTKPFIVDAFAELVEPLAARGYQRVAHVLKRKLRWYRWLGPDVETWRLPERILHRARGLLGVVPEKGTPLLGKAR